MANIAVGDKVLVTYKGSLFGQTIMNTFAFRCQQASAPLTIQAAGVSLHNGLNAAYGYKIPFLACMPTSYTLDETWIQVVGPVRYRKQVFVEATDGIFDVQCQTANVAAVITRHAEESGRRYMSALHLLCPTGTDAIAGGNVTAELRDKMEDLCDAIVTFSGFVGASVQFAPSIPHPLYVPNPSQWTDLVGAFPQTTTRVMRRRTVGVGI